MRSIESDELKQIELDILTKIDHVCRKNNFCYSLCGGTLLGAIRHKGYIPWDDDIDIAMPRDDYDKFLNYCISNEKECGFRIVSTINDKRYAYLFAKACALNTIIEEENFNPNGADVGVYVDIFPIDGLGSKEEAKSNFEATRFKRELLVARNWKRFFRSKTHAWYIEPIRFGFWIMSRFVSANALIEKIDRYYLRFPLSKSEYAAVVCGSYREKEILPTEVLNTFTEVEFEGKQFMAFEKFDDYLSSIYGDYMKLPPKDKQESHHMLFQLDEPEMVKTENIVLPPKEAETDDRAEIAGRTVKQIINILPPEWEDTFGRPITSIGEINLLEQRHYAADWDVLRPAKELAEYSTLTSEDLEELLHEAEKIIEGWPIPDEHGAGESADNGDGESAGVGTECGADVGAGTEENGDRADL